MLYSNSKEELETMNTTELTERLETITQSLSTYVEDICKSDFEDEFAEYMDSEYGSVYVGNWCGEPAEVLKATDYDEYDTQLMEWFEENREDLSKTDIEWQELTQEVEDITAILEQRNLDPKVLLEENKALKEEIKALKDELNKIKESLRIVAGN